MDKKSWRILIVHNCINIKYHIQLFAEQCYTAIMNDNMLNHEYLSEELIQNFSESWLTIIYIPKYKKYIAIRI